MNRLIPMLLLTLVGCAKHESSGTGGVVAQEGGITSETKVPDDKVSRQFADYVVRNPVKDFEPGDAGSVQLTWKTLTFGAKNRFQADAKLVASGENFTCEEKGDWAMENPADSAERGVMVLTIDKSDCPGRPSSGKIRLGLIVHDGTYDIKVY